MTATAKEKEQYPEVYVTLREIHALYLDMLFRADTPPL